MRRRPWLVLAVLASAWAVGVFILVPQLIRAVHAGRIDILAGLFEGRATVPVERYLAHWSTLARPATFLLANTLAIFGVLRWLFRRPREDAASPASERPTLGHVILAAVWFGLATGVAEAYYVGAKSLFLHEIVPEFRYAGPNALWMVPLGNAVLFGILGLVLAPVLLLAKRSSGQAGAEHRLLVGLGSGVSFLVLLMVPDRIQLWSAALLAAGLAVGVSRAGVLERHLRRPFLSYRVLGLIAVSIACWVVVKAAERVQERMALGQAPSRTAVTSPNILLLVLDTQRAQSMSLYGHSRSTTPRLDRLAREGVVFDRAIASAPWTLPSHATMFTGRYNAQLQTGLFEGLDDRFLTLAESLRDRGYATGGFVGNTVFGNDFYGLNQGFSRYMDEATSLGAALEATWLGRDILGWIRRKVGDHRFLARQRADVVNREFLEWVDRPRGARPFFAFLNYFDSHAPYRAPAPFGRRFATGGGIYWLKGETVDSHTPSELRQLKDSYDGATAYVDDQIWRLVEALRARGLLDRTLLIVTGDHGEAFGEHGMMGHGNDLYLPDIWVPLFIRYPDRVPGGLRVHAPVSARDIPATAFDLLGLPEASPFPGATLARYWGGGSSRPVADTVLAEHGLMNALFAGRYHFIRDESAEAGRTVLFDMETDPAETRNLATGAGELVRAFQRTLEGMTLKLARPRQQ